MLFKSFSETFQRHDVSKSGRLSLQEVRQAVQVRGRALRRGNPELGAAASAAASADGRGGGLTKKQAVGHTLDEAAFLAVCRSFDPNRTGDVALPEFVALCSFLESARATFVAYDPQRTGVISLNYSQCVYVCAQTR